jgi:hypothetical protein
MGNWHVMMPASVVERTKQAVWLPAFSYRESKLARIVANLSTRVYGQARPGHLTRGCYEVVLAAAKILKMTLGGCVLQLAGLFLVLHKLNVALSFS